MIKKTVKYEDYNGVEREEDLYFNLSEAELMKMELGTNGGYAEMIEKIIKAKDQPVIIKLFSDILEQSYGVKSDDGKRFIKNKQVLDDFLQSESYNVLFMELLSDAAKAAEFVNGILPKKLTNDETVKAKVAELKADLQ